MNLIRPYYEIIEQGPGLQGIWDIIEVAGKTSYKSPVKGGNEAKKFVDWRASEKHGAVLEFGTVYLKIAIPRVKALGSIYTKEELREVGEFDDLLEIWNFYRDNKFSVVNTREETMDYKDKSDYPADVYYITTNYRVIIENGREKDLKYLCDMPEIGTFEEPKHERRYCIRFIIDRFTGEEFLRHRVFSFCRESTRYCNYSKDKFGNNITYIIPPWISSNVLSEGENVSWWDGDWCDTKSLKIVKVSNYNQTKRFDRVDLWLEALYSAESNYQALTNDWSDVDGISEEEMKPWQAQQARTILPCAIKSPLVMCGFERDFYHWFHLRALGTTGAPHPQAKEMAYPLMDEFIEKGYISKPILYSSTHKYKKAIVPSLPERGEICVYDMANGKWYDVENDVVYVKEAIEFI